MNAVGQGRRFVVDVMAFFNRKFVLLWHGQMVSQLGNQAFLIAAAYLTLDATGSTTALAAVMMASTVPLVLLGPLGGTVADHHSRRVILITTDLLRALAVGSLALCVMFVHDVSTTHVTLLIAVAAFNGVAAALFTPAVQAIIPDLVQQERLAAANSLSQFSNQGAVLIGQAMGGVLYVQWGAAGLLLFDAMSFGYAALAAWFLPADRPRPRHNDSLFHSVSRYIVETTEGVTYLRARPEMMFIAVTFAGVNFLFMPVFALLPVYVRTVLDAGPEWYGFLLAGSGAGALCGTTVAGMLLSQRSTDTRTLVRCMAAVSGGVLLLSATSSVWIALVAFVSIGVFSAVINIIVITMFQIAVPAEIRARVMALVVALSTAAVPLGMGLGGVMGDLWRESLRWVVAACGGAMTIVMLMAMSSCGAWKDARRP